MRRLTLDTAVLEVVESALGGRHPTQKRLLGLLAELTQRRARMTEANMPLDDQDRELGRVPHRPRTHAELLNRHSPENLEAALGNLRDAERHSARKATEHLAEKIAENEARGLHRTAPAIEEDSPVNPNDHPEPSPPRPSASAPDAPNSAEAPPDETAEIERRKSEGIRRTREVAERLERGVLQRMPALRLQGRSLKTLEEAADILIAELQPTHQDAIRQVCIESDMDPWVVLLGAIARMADLQELHAGEFEDHWKNRQGRGATAASAKIERCQMCGGDLPPDPLRKNRVACCSRHGSGQVQHTQPGENALQPEGCPLRARQMVNGQWITVPNA